MKSRATQLTTGMLYSCVFLHARNDGSQSICCMHLSSCRIYHVLQQQTTSRHANTKLFKHYTAFVGGMQILFSIFIILYDVATGNYSRVQIAFLYLVCVINNSNCGLWDKAAKPIHVLPPDTTDLEIVHPYVFTEGFAQQCFIKACIGLSRYLMAKTQCTVASLIGYQEYHISSS